MERNSVRGRCSLDDFDHRSPYPPDVVRGGGENDYDDDDDGEEALSLCDLPQIDNEEDSNPLRFAEALDDFDFCSLSKESEMCVADEVFFQGHLRPLHRSIDSGDGLSRSLFNRTVSRSQSADSRAYDGSITSRSRSSSSSSSSGSSTRRLQRHPVNIFHSQPSPSPKLQGIRITDSRNCTNTSYSWNAIRLGLIAAPSKIAFQDLKTRTDCKDRGGRHRTGSSSRDKKKTRTNLLGGCDCLLGAVHTVPSEIVVIKRSASAARTPPPEGDILIEKISLKKRVSHHRTFEWLKQLSLAEQRMNCTG